MQQQYIITPVKNFVEKAIKLKMFTPTDLSYPGFKVSKEQSVSWLANLIQTKVLINYNLFMYKSRVLSGLDENHEFADLITADKEVELKKRNPANANVYTVLEVSLPEDMKRDPNLAGEKKIQELAKQSFVFGLSHHIKAVMLDIDAANIGPINEFKSSAKDEKISGLAATMICLQKSNPAVFKELRKEIERNPLKTSGDSVLKEIDAPSDLTVATLYNYDKKFTREHFPTQSFVLEGLESTARRVMKKMS